MPPLPPGFFRRGADQVAPDLLGCILVRRAADGTQRRARIVETEAYVGEHDKASHARAGRTPRTSTMYGPPGRAYVYFVYGVHHMLNLVCGPVGDPQAVLVRACEPLGPWRARMSGPGLVAAALGLDRRQDGMDLVGRAPRDLPTPLRIEAPRAREGAWPLPRSGVLVGPRIGVGYAGSWAAAPLRFGVAGSRALSRPFPRPSPRPGSPSFRPAPPRT